MALEFANLRHHCRFMAVEKENIMIGLISRLLICMLGLAVASAIIPGVNISGFWTLVGAAFLLGIVNAFIRPIAVILTFPITLVTLGLFLLVINAAMLGLVASMMDGFTISGFFSALFASIVISIVSTLASWFIGNSGFEIMTVRRG